ncbi:MAG TPA: DUF1587 domain-containing protein, partial [Bryobacteraceae bacterium]|nr:DUF1587 domain-containing protein [Bryobacteraceae bacterium]
MRKLLSTSILILAPAALVYAQGSARPATAASSPRQLVDQYCVTCHNSKAKVGGLALDKVDLTQTGDNAEVLEKVVRKLRAGMMPPPGARRPSLDALQGLASTLENELDRAAAAKPYLLPPGVHRVNRTEYTNAVHDLLGLDVDAAAYLPVDDSSSGFDNVAGSLTVSPALVEGYMTAAAKISRLALGHETAPEQKKYIAPQDYSQENHVEGLP